MFRLALLFSTFLVFSTLSFAHETGDSSSNCETCPDMIVVPSGKAMIGAELYEANRKRGDDDVLAVLTELFTQHGPPLHIRSDNGSEFTAGMA